MKIIEKFRSGLSAQMSKLEQKLDTVNGIFDTLDIANF